jgi:hypothetical protein
VVPGGRFVCDYCGNEHIFNLPAAQPALRATAQAEPLPAPRPSRVQVERRGDTLQLSWRWFTPKYIFLALFCVVWDGFLCFWYSMVLGSGAPIFMAAFPILHLVIGVVLTYTVIAGFLNRTTLTLNSREFSVRHDPAPWPGEVKTSAGNLAQLYCKEKRTRGKHGDTFTYELHAALREGKQITLVAGLDSPDIARFLEQEIEMYLNIEDRPVYGELRG